MPNHLICKSDRPSHRTSHAAYVGDEPDPTDMLLNFKPYIHTHPRRNSITPDRQRAFISTLAATGIVTQAARAIGASLEALYKLRNKPDADGFAQAWERAIDRGIARLEDCALERALMGEERPVVSLGKVVATYRRYDTALLLFLLRQRRPQRYRQPAPLVAEDNKPSEQEIFDSIDAKLDLMRQRSLERDKFMRQAKDDGD